MSSKNQIGLDTKKSEQLAEMLSDLLANYSIFYQNVRGFHWNISGDKFFELHEKFEELYNDLFHKIDEVAERILTLGFNPDHNYSDYLKIATISESKEKTEAEMCVKNILDSFKILLEKERKVLETAGDIGDEGTNALMSDYIREQEKLVWMYSAFLNKNIVSK